MRIWLVTIGEPVPVGKGERDRLHRAGFFAHFLAEHGHDVTWWTSTFDHFRKQHWFDDDAEFVSAPRMRVKLLHGGGYSSNLSLARFRDHRRIAGKFARRVRQESDRPDIIVASLPTIELCLESTRFGREFEIPVVLDMRDMWPDIFVDMAPRPMRPIARVALRSLFKQARTACKQATAITGITDGFVEWGVRQAGRERLDNDRAFPMGYMAHAPSSDHIREARKFWDQRGVGADSAGRNVVFVGTIGRHFDLETVLAAGRELATRGSSIRLVLCGRGDRLEYFKKRAAGMPNVLFPGWVDAAAIHVLLRRAAVGLDPLPDRYDFLTTINNKAIEYLSAGLPIISTPRNSLLADLLATEQCGISYEHGDVNQLIAILDELQRDTDRLKTMAHNADRLFRERFTAERVYGEMMAHLQHIISLA